MADDLPKLACIPPADIETFWPHIEPLIDRAYERYGSQDERRNIEKQIKVGLALVWIAWSDNRRIEAALVTDLIKEDGRLICQMRALAGNRIRRWFRLLEKIEEFARSEKCSEIRYFGRPGWVSMFGPDYRVTHVQAAKKLS